jgi:hypothetical protein
MKISHETKRAKKIIVEIVRQAGGQLRSKTDLFRAFWKAHLHYAANNPGYLSTWPIVRTPCGPAIADFDYLLSEMLSDGWLAVEDTQDGTDRMLVLSLGSSCPPISLPPVAIEAIRQAANAAASVELHRQSRVWLETKDGEEMDIYLDLIDDDERARLEADFAILKSAMSETYSTSGK